MNLQPRKRKLGLSSKGFRSPLLQKSTSQSKPSLNSTKTAIIEKAKTPSTTTTIVKKEIISTKKSIVNNTLKTFKSPLANASNKYVLFTLAIFLKKTI